MIYFDNAATTQMSEEALKAFVEVSLDNFGNASSVYSYGRKSKEIINKSREVISRAIGANEDEIYFSSCGTESDNWAIEHVKYMNMQSIITTSIEHHAILNPVKKKVQEGCKAIYLPVDKNGIVDKEYMKSLLNGEKKFVSIMLQNNETGMIQPVGELAKMVHADNPESIIHTDAVQAVGHIKIDVNELGIDMLSASAHKFNGPKGTGFLYVREGISVFPFIVGGGQERGKRSGTENVAGIFSMAKALEENVNNISINNKRIKKMEDLLLKHLDSAGIYYEINGGINNKAAGILNIAFKGIDGEAMLYALDSQGIMISTGSACNSKSKNRSYVLEAMGLDKNRIDSSIRISIGVYNTEKEIDILAENIIKYVKLIKALNS